MKVTGTFEKMDDGVYTGNIASLDFDYPIILEPVEGEKANGKAPDYRVLGKSPGGTAIDLGAGWSKTSQAKNPYVSFSVDLGRCGAFNLNLVSMNGVLTVIEWADTPNG